MYFHVDHMTVLLLLCVRYYRPVTPKLLQVRPILCDSGLPALIPGRDNKFIASIGSQYCDVLPGIKSLDMFIKGL